MSGYRIEIKKGWRWNPDKKRMERVTTFRKSIAQHKADRTAKRYARKTPAGAGLPGLYPGKKS